MCNEGKETFPTILCDTGVGQPPPDMPSKTTAAAWKGLRKDPITSSSRGSLRGIPPCRRMHASNVPRCAPASRGQTSMSSSTPWEASSGGALEAAAGDGRPGRWARGGGGSAQ